MEVDHIGVVQKTVTWYKGAERSIVLRFRRDFPGEREGGSVAVMICQKSFTLNVHPCAVEDISVFLTLIQAMAASEKLEPRATEVANDPAARAFWAVSQEKPVAYGIFSLLPA